MVLKKAFIEHPENKVATQLQAIDNDSYGKGSSMRSVTTQKDTQNAEEKRRRARTLAKQQQAAERIASSSSELGRGISQAFAAVEELNAAMEQISSGAKQSASASHQSLGNITQCLEKIRLQAADAETSREKTKALQILLDRISSEIDELVKNVGVAAERQSVSIEKMVELEKQAEKISEAVKAVIRIADQTNLLALKRGDRSGTGG